MDILKTCSKIIIIVSTILALFYLGSAKVNAQAIIFQDNFDDGNADDWTVVENRQWSNPSEPCMYWDEPARWEVVDNKYGIKIDGLSCYTNTIPNSISIPPNQDYSFEVDMTFTQSAYMDRNFIFKYQDPANWYGLHIVGSGVGLEKVIAGNGYGLPGALFNYPFEDNETYHFKVEVTNTEFRIYINYSLITTIPEEDPVFPNSKAGLRAGVGSIPETEVWFDNILVKSLGEEGFDLPFVYEGRPTATNQQFKSAFWKRLTAVFDHVLRTNSFRPFTGQTYGPRNCLYGAAGISCYDSHNGTDFSKKGGKDVLSVSEGTVVFTSEHTRRNCTPNRGGFGCVVIVEYPGNIFGLYAHLNKIFVNEGNAVNADSILGVMGNTGCPSCGVHLHFGVIKLVGEVSSFNVSKMTRGDWKELLYQARPYQTPTPLVPIIPNIPTYRPSCTYRAPNGQRFNFQDPSGWKGADADPWSKPTSEGGCDADSPYLWKFDVGTSP